MLSAAVAALCTAGAVSDVAVATRGNDPGTAKLTALVVIDTSCETPGASVTLLVPRVAARAAGAARARSKVSIVWPVLVTFSWKVLPGAPEDGARVTATPAASTSRVPLAVDVAAGLVVDVAVTLNGSLPAAVPTCGVRVSVTSRKLLMPGGTSMVVWEKVPLTPAGRVSVRAK